MKKVLFILSLFILVQSIKAQSPQKISYQAVIRDSKNNVVAIQLVSVKLSILKSSAFGETVYSEVHSINTNVNGLISVQIGAGTVVTGSISAIKWEDGPYFIKTETDPTGGGSNYSITGTSEILSVPLCHVCRKSWE